MPSADVVIGSIALLAVVGCSPMAGVGVGDLDAGDEPDTSVPADPVPEPEPEPDPEPDPVPDAGSEPPGPPPTLKLARTPQIDGFLTDGAGQPLYFYVNDIAASQTTACLDACAQKWKPYDADPTRVGPGIEPGEVARFHRQDGDWQLTYKGFPLYRRPDEMGLTAPTAEGVNGRWFVARDYLAFMAPPKNFEPAGVGAPDAPFLTDGFGRTLYVNLDDVPRAGSTPPTTTCTGECLATRTPVFARVTVRTTSLPSLLNATDLNAFTRPDGTKQLTYRGWPLYYFAGDKVAGQTSGHNELSWRAIDPLTFGTDAAALVLPAPATADAGQ